MRLTRRVRIQLVVIGLISLIAGAVMGVGYIGLPSMLFGIGRYEVTMQLPATGGLYKSSNVTYRGQEVGRVTGIRMTDNGVEAVLSLRSSIQIPADLDAQVHSRTAIGEQYVELVPRPDPGESVLKNGDVIPVDRTSIPPDINILLDKTNAGLEAIPRDNLKTVIDEGAAAVGGLGPEISRIVKGSTALAIDAKKNLPGLTNLIDQSKPVLDTQADTSDAIAAWAAHIADITGQVQQQNTSVQGLLQNGPAAADEGRKLFERLQPTLPILLANLTSVSDIAVTYHAGVEQLLVLLPQAIAVLDSSLVPNLGNPSAYAGPFVTFDLNLNVPPPCLTGYLPPSQQRSMAMEDYPDRPPGNVYCRVPQDSPFNVRGARNIPCPTKPGKRAPTAKMCESDEQYVPLNDGYNWKGDPNATTSGQDIPQMPASAPARVPAPPPDQNEPVPPPIAAAQYDPSTGAYVAPDGQLYTQANLAEGGNPQTWQSMLLPPAN
ncbi:MlaD family protein [Mycobacterium sp. CVI_P3]|uniref:MlaD family protein n=1 Tax=Mycobacterium pinniadriaticum TaxID=2994102 RepID=A0ABT3SLV2_9MYCO|nr:MlaD family protein [Mycobacterium pinniadriaticum]MCX2934084.1 MlaD family protein [Mycobacterium pinniadriaticum]MCX2940506.1 MlaD family protein [Mycobacterium pinniadriaticum]